jgi:hypothetical protein
VGGHILMAITLKVTKNQTVTLNEPTRSMFPSNLGGAVEFNLTHLLFSILSVMGEGVGEFGAGIAVRFMERIEPSLVEIAAPFLDVMLQAPDLDPVLRTFLQNLKNPQHEVELGMLADVVGGISGLAPATFFDCMRRPLDRYVLSRFQNGRPDLETLYHMFYMGNIDRAKLNKWGHELGWDDTMLAAYSNLLQGRPDVSTLLEAYKRGSRTAKDVTDELTRHGFNPVDAGLYLTLSQHVLATNEIVTMGWRGLIDHTEQLKRLAALGYTPTDGANLLNIATNLPAVGDVIRLAVREAWNDPTSQKYGYDQEYPGEVADIIKKTGYDPDWGKRYWRAHWELPSVSQAEEMVHRGIITPAEFDDLLRVQDIAPYWRSKMHQAIFSPYTRVDVRRMYKEGVLTYAQMLQAYKDIGYDDAKAKTMADFTDKLEFPDPDTKPAKYRELTSGLLETAYIKNLITLDDYKLQLKKIKYPDDEIPLIIAVSDLKKHVDGAPDYVLEYQKDMKSLVERSYSSGILDEASARAALETAGYVTAEIDYILKSSDYDVEEEQRNSQIKLLSTAYTNRAIDKISLIAELGKLELTGRQQDALIVNLDLDLKFNSRRLTEAEYTKAWKLGYIDEAEFRKDITALGYSDYDIELLVKLDAPPKLT